PCCHHPVVYRPNFEMSSRQLAMERNRHIAAVYERLALHLFRHWQLLVVALSGFWLGLAVLAPWLMAIGLELPARIIYWFYSFQCHQLPQRSYFLFGQAGSIQTYSLDQILVWGANVNYLRAFLGNPEIGYKIAFDMRLTALHSALFVSSLLWVVLGRRLPRLSLIGYLLLSLPMTLDGGSHLLSEITGLGFRDSNTWAMWLTGSYLSPSFYSGTTIGTLNWLLRTITGAIFGLATSWLAFSYLSYATHTQRKAR
ncbi:MAG: hypothetical protein ACUVSF_10035, partial [Anaerolineae bacterium]